MSMQVTTRTATIVAGIGLVVVWFGVRPLHVRASTIESESRRLDRMVEEQTVPEAELEAVSAEAERRNRMIREEGVDGLPVGAPDLAAIIRDLSLPIDGSRVLDQTFTARQTGPAGLGAPDWWRSSPIEVELTADWESIRMFLGFVDSIETPVRTTSLRLERTDDPRGLARLRLELDALHLSAPSGTDESDPAAGTTEDRR